jgi:hypothetical protein
MAPSFVPEWWETARRMAAAAAASSSSVSSIVGTVRIIIGRHLSSKERATRPEVPMAADSRLHLKSRAGLHLFMSFVPAFWGPHRR